MPTKDQNKIDIQEINKLRSNIDSIDNQLIHLLANRMNVSRAIGEYKKLHQIQIVQSKRYDELLNRLCEQGIEVGLTAQFVTDIMNIIHKESIKQQNFVIDNND